MPADERDAFLADLGLHETGLARVIRAGYELLGLITFFTAGPKEARAWTVHKGAKAPEAAGEIHTDFERGFIRAETIAYDDFVDSAARPARGRRQDALGRQGICRPGRRRAAVPVQRLVEAPRVPRASRHSIQLSTRGIDKPDELTHGGMAWRPEHELEVRERADRGGASAISAKMPRQSK